MAVDVTAVDFSTLGDTFKKVTQHMRVSPHAPSSVQLHGCCCGRGGDESPVPSRPRTVCVHLASNLPC